LVLGAFLFVRFNLSEYLVNWLPEHRARHSGDGCNPVIWLFDHVVFQKYCRES